MAKEKQIKQKSTKTPALKTPKEKKAAKLAKKNSKARGE